MLLKNKTIMITGIGPGMGSQLAHIAANEGASGIILVSRSLAKMQSVEAQLKEQHPQLRTLLLTADISKQDECQNIVQQSYAEFARVDALINNAYAHHAFKSIEKSDISDWQGVFDINFFGSLYLTQALLLKMKTHGGAITMISSMASRSVNPGEAAYACSKSALNTATQYLAKEAGQYGIRINTLAPGWMWGASVQSHFKQMEERGLGTAAELKKAVEKDIALGVMPTDEDCAKAALFLVSDYAKAVHGVCLDANGGHFIAH